MLTLNNVCWKPEDGEAVLKRNRSKDSCRKADRGDGTKWRREKLPWQK